MQYKKNLSRIIFGYLLIVIVCLGLAILTTQIAVAKPGLSPAGGGYLTLENDNDFVSTVKPWFPDKKFTQLTIEAWIYIDVLPAPNTYWCIFGQEGRFEFVFLGFQGGSLGSHVWSSDALCKFAVNIKSIPLNKWIHIFASYSAAIGWGIGGDCHNGQQGGSISKSNRPFRLGGLIASDRFSFFGKENVILRGYIDEVRVSDIIRYDPILKGSYDVPVGYFKPDKHTIGLWHFDGGNAFKDESGNNYTLWKNETIAVQGQDKLPIAWGKLKGNER